MATEFLLLKNSRIWLQIVVQSCATTDLKRMYRLCVRNYFTKQDKN